MEYLYHGSIVPNITELIANAKSHDGKSNVLYLTDSLPYSLFYIWDSKHNLKKGKHVTCGIKNGVFYYEEQFENQLKRFYDEVSGYVYVVNNSKDFRRVSDRESMWFSENNVSVFEVIYISNVYDEINKYVDKGKIKITKYSEMDKDKIKALYDHISERIVRDGFLEHPESEDAVFYKTFFSKSWKAARNK